MNSDEICGVPGPGGAVCSMPYGHPGDIHGFAIPLSPEIGQLIEGYIEQLDAERRKVTLARRWLYVAVAVYVLIALGGLFIW